MSLSPHTNKLFFSAISLFALIFVFAQPIYSAQAQTLQSLKISPAIISLELSPGKTFQKTITIENLLDDPLPINASVEGFDASDEDYGIKVSDNGSTTPLANWITIQDSESIIPAHTSKIYDISINIPDKVELGGYYAVIFFTPLLPQSLANQNIVNTRIGALVLANIGVSNTDNQGSIVTLETDKKIYQTGPLHLTTRIKNTGLGFFSTKPMVTLKSIFGKPLEFPLEEKTILPGKVRRWESTLPAANLWPLFYKIEIKSSLENGQFITAQSFFLGFPIKYSLLFLLLLFIISYLFTHRNNLHKAIKILIKKT